MSRFDAKQIGTFLLAVGLLLAWLPLTNWIAATTTINAGLAFIVATAVIAAGAFLGVRFIREQF